MTDNINLKLEEEAVATVIAHLLPIISNLPSDWFKYEAEDPPEYESNVIPGKVFSFVRSHRTSVSQVPRQLGYTLRLVTGFDEIQKRRSLVVWVVNPSDDNWENTRKAVIDCLHMLASKPIYSQASVTL